MIRTLAPSGNPVRARDLLNCLLSVHRNPAHLLSECIRTSLGTENVFLLATGRCAMSVLLDSMAKESAEHHRRTIVVPTYTCYSVAASALKLGLRVLVCDVEPDTLRYDQEQLESIDFTGVLAIVATSLYGLPEDLSALEALASANGVYLIDDAAQSLGARVGERPVGTFGDAGILSFDKGKVITSINGGAIVTNDRSLAHRIGEDLKNINQQSFIKRTNELIKLHAYYLFLRPSLYWIPSSLPFLHLGETHYDETFSIEKYFGFLGPVALAQYSRLTQTNEHRRSCAMSYAKNIQGTGLIGHVSTRKENHPVYLRFPLLIRNAEKRHLFLKECRNLGCSISYPLPIPDVPDIRKRIKVHNDTYTGGREIAEQLVTLPTHAYINDSDVAQISSIVDSLQATRA